MDLLALAWWSSLLQNPLIVVLMTLAARELIPRALDALGNRGRAYAKTTAATWDDDLAAEVDARLDKLADDIREGRVSSNPLEWVGIAKTALAQLETIRRGVKPTPRAAPAPSGSPTPSP